MPGPLTPSRPGWASCFHALVHQVSFSPFNHTQLCVSGAGVFKLFRYADGCLKQSSLAKVDSITLLSHAWMAAERVVAGTDAGRLLLFENGELRRELLMSAAEAGQAARSQRVFNQSFSCGFLRVAETLVSLCASTGRWR